MTDHARTPDSAKPGLEDEHTRIADKSRFTGEPEVEGVPAEEDIEGADLDERLDENPESAANRRDVPREESAGTGTGDR